MLRGALAFVHPTLLIIQDLTPFFVTPFFARRSTVSGGEPIIRGTRISVYHLIERVQAGQSVEDILAALPHLTAAQIYAALSYYHDHKAEMDRLIEESRPERVVAAQG